jgi:hypothetical protein
MSVANYQPSRQTVQPTGWRAPPGWYASPEGQPGLRWWDGERWTPYVRPGPSALPPAPSALPQTKATTSMVLGLLGLMLAPITWFDLAVAIPALVLGIVALRESNRGVAGGRGMAIAGIVTGAMVCAIDAVLLVAWLTLSSDASGALSTLF